MRRLRSHLLGWLLLPTLLLWALALRLGYQRSLDQAHEAYDRTLLGAAMAIAERVGVDEGRVQVELPYAALEMLHTGAQDRIFYRVGNLDPASFISGYEDLPAPPGLPEPGRSLVYEAAFRGESLRLVALVRPLYEPGQPGPVLVLVGETMGAREVLSRRILTDATLTQLALIACAALLIALGVQRGLQPLKALRDEVQARRKDDLSPIATRNVPREVVPLVEAINLHTQRQRELSEWQQRFLVNASHQLKTPLAVLRTQAAYALRQTELEAMRDSVRQLHEGSQSTARLVQQLLTLARSDPTRPRAVQAVDLGELAGELLLDLVVLARSRGIDLGLERVDETAPGPVVSGERLLLREALSNLVHNAIIYTPSGGRVTLRVAAPSPDSSGPVIEVEDDGPGVPEAERERVFERFYRGAGGGNAEGPDGSEGSGLGLAIVRDVCERHGVRIELGEGQGGQGLLVRLNWPATTASAA